MEIKKLALSVGLAVAALGSIGAAQATYLQILTGQGFSREVSGDPAGSLYPYAGGPGPGAGLPSSIWPTSGPGFAPDPSFGNALGTSGFDASYLWLSQSANVTFQFMGGGNSGLANQFWVNGVQLFQDPPSNNATNPCAVTPNGATAPTCTPGLNQFTIPIAVAAGGGYVPFWFVTGNGVTVANDGTGNTPDDSGLPGFMLGADPYLAPGPFSCSNEPGNPSGFNGTCNTVYAGLSDLSRIDPATGQVIDHDYGDMGVRITVPEPGSLFLLGAGLLGLAGARRRKLNK